MFKLLYCCLGKDKIAQILFWRWTQQPTDKDEMDHTPSPTKGRPSIEEREAEKEANEDDKVRYLQFLRYFLQSYISLKKYLSSVNMSLFDANFTIGFHSVNDVPTCSIDNLYITIKLNTCLFIVAGERCFVWPRETKARDISPVGVLLVLGL